MKKKIIFGLVLFLVIFVKNSLSPNYVTACGAAYEFCCTSPGATACDNSSGSNLSCVGGHCVPGSACGSAGAACCAGNVCNSGIQCVNGSCGTARTGNEMCNNGLGINTAIGCISVLDNQNAFLGDILRWAVGIGGGIAFLLIVYAGFMVMTAAGNPERLKAGQELLTSAISGLILLIFSIFILRFIGIDILGLGKFGFGQ